MTSPEPVSVVDLAPPKSMAEALDWESPEEALLALSKASSQKAEALALNLAKELEHLSLSPPKALVGATKTKGGSSNKRHSDEEDPIDTSMASADSILNSLTKIATGGTQASQEIRTLESEKRELEQHAMDVETALSVRRNSDAAADALSSQNYAVASRAVQEYTLQKEQGRHTKRALAYAGNYTVDQMETTVRVLKQTLLERYRAASQEKNLKILGELTPFLQRVQMEQEAVSLYLKYLQSIIVVEWKEAAQKPLEQPRANPELPQSRASQRREEERKKAAPPPPPYLQMARVYNCAVTTLRHHLPMISHCLYKADGDAGLVQLVHAQVEQHVVPLFHLYVSDRQLNVVARNSQRIYNLLEDKYVGSHTNLEEESSSLTMDMDDCGFSVEVGGLSDVDGALEEAALCLQHAESFMRFLQHTVQEINKARQIRYEQQEEEKKMERERLELTMGVTAERETDIPYKQLEILPPHTQLHEVVAEVGGYYSAIERCLLLASMQRAFQSMALLDPRQYSTLGIPGHSTVVGTKALKTSLVETCLYAARHGTQRAFATGHTGTASAMANFCSDCLGGVLLEVMTRRAQESGVAPLKPGEGLLEGSSSLFKLGNAVGSAVVGRDVDDATRRQKMEQGVGRACATLNDMEVAVHHTQQLGNILLEAIDNGFPPNSHDTEQLRMCVKSIAPVTESFRAASNAAVESLVSILTPRVRAIVGDVVGSESSASASFMSTSVMGTKGTERVTVRMNYDLDDDAYKLLQLSEGYMARLCSTMDELVYPLRLHLSPRLSDALVLGVVGSAAKRLESALRRCHFTALGALSLDSDMRDLLSYAKDNLDSPELKSNMSLYRACVPLARLLQISKLLNVDDLEDVVDLISASKRKGNWDLKLEDAKAFLSLRVEFEAAKVNELLRISDTEE